MATYSDLVNSGGYTAQKPTTLGKISQFVGGYQQAADEQRARAIQNAALQKTYADMAQAGFNVQQQQEPQSLIGKLLNNVKNNLTGSSPYQVDMQSYQTPAIRTIQALQGGDQPNFISQGGKVIANPNRGMSTWNSNFVVDKIDSKGGLTLKNRPTNAWQVPEGMVLSEMRYDKEGNAIPVYKTQDQWKSTPAAQEYRAKRLEKFITSKEEAKAKIPLIKDAMESAKRLPQGFFGSMKIDYLKFMDPSNPILSDWQKVKAVLTDDTLMNTAKTKGAISDREMELFKEAAANDDIPSIARMMPVFEKMLQALDTELASKGKSYQALYGEDPNQYLDSSNGGVPSWVPSWFNYEEARQAGATDEAIRNYLQSNPV